MRKIDTSSNYTVTNCGTTFKIEISIKQFTVNLNYIIIAYINLAYKLL